MRRLGCPTSSSRLLRPQVRSLVFARRMLVGARTRPPLREARLLFSLAARARSEPGRARSCGRGERGPLQQQALTNDLQRLGRGRDCGGQGGAGGGPLARALGGFQRDGVRPKWRWRCIGVFRCARCAAETGGGGTWLPLVGLMRRSGSGVEQLAREGVTTGMRASQRRRLATYTLQACPRRRRAANRTRAVRLHPAYGTGWLVEGLSRRTRRAKNWARRAGNRGRIVQRRVGRARRVRRASPTPALPSSAVPLGSSFRQWRMHEHRGRSVAPWSVQCL